MANKLTKTVVASSNAQQVNPVRVAPKPKKEAAEHDNGASHKKKGVDDTKKKNGINLTSTPARKTDASFATPRTEPELNSSPQATSQALLTEDSAGNLQKGQMRKTIFLELLRAEITRTIEPVLNTAGQTTKDCPYMNYWLDLYHQKDAAHIEQTVQKYAPASIHATSAEEYVSIVAQRALRAAVIWATTGRLSGIPPGVPTTLPGQPARKNTVLTKAREGGARITEDPTAIQQQLGEGAPLTSDVRGRMEAAFGTSLSHVRMHTDPKAAEISGSMNARAFAVGHHIAFGSGEYAPGTLLGDALIAHELAHTLQQQGAEQSDALSPGDARYASLEQDADKAAASVISFLWDRTKKLGSAIKQNAATSMRSGLRLQKCSDGRVTGNLTAVTSGELQGGWSVHDYLQGASWAPMTSPPIFAGRDANNFKVQIHGPFEGKENIGVSQTITHGPSNAQFLRASALIVGRSSLNVGETIPDRVLNAADPFAVTPWRLRYKDGQASFADVPMAMPGDQGYIDFTTTFHSKAADAPIRTASVVWRWSVDLTQGHNDIDVTQQSSTTT